MVNLFIILRIKTIYHSQKLIMKNKLFNIFSIALLSLLLLSSCSVEYKIRKENKKYKKISTGIRYSTYKKASENGLTAILNKYNESNDSIAVSEESLHSYIGLLMLIAKQNRFAAAEADIILSRNKSSINNYAAHSIIASIKRTEELNFTTKIEENIADSIYNNSDISKICDFDKFSVELIKANNNLHNQDYVSASANFANLVSITSVKWPSDICNILSDIKNGNSNEASLKYKKLKNNKGTPEIIQEWSEKIIPDLIANPEKLIEYSDLPNDIIKIYVKGRFTYSTISYAKDIAEKMLFTLLEIKK